MYLEYFLKRRLAERLMGNNDALGLQNLYQVYSQQENISLRNASTELKMTNLKPRVFKRMQSLNRLESLQYEINL
jgi:signal recognition particle GTPase